MNKEDLIRICSQELVADGGLISIMGNNNEKIKDVPVVSEALSCLLNALNSETIKFETVSEDQSNIDNFSERVVYRKSPEQILYFMDIKEDTISERIFWAAEKLPAIIKEKKGTYIFLYSIEEYNGIKRLIPEWFNLFYMDNNVNTCVPILACYSVLNYPEFSDWVPVSLYRSETFFLPVQAAINNIQSNK